MTTRAPVPEAKPKYSVLIIGKTQSGKSTLVQWVKHYVDRQYQIDDSLIGNGNGSVTAIPTRFVIKSDLPEYEVIERDNRVPVRLPGKLVDKNIGENDYLDHLMLRDKEFELREVGRDADCLLSSLVELVFLDTPGLNDTKQDDSVHAENIIKEVIDTGSFNLILFVFNNQNPLTTEQHIALSYYAKVLKDFQPTFAILFTHVKYEDCHYSNEDHQKKIDMRLQATSRILLGASGESFQTKNAASPGQRAPLKTFPYFTIDFDTKKRPIKQWMIRNTLREILQHAVHTPPVKLNSSKSNLDGIRSIPHPTKDNDEKIKKFRICRPVVTKQHEEPSKKTQTVNTTNVSSEKQINILLLGDVQSGKTSLVETMKVYAKPNYVANLSHVNIGIRHVADKKVRITSFQSDIPYVEIRHQRQHGSGCDVINLKEAAKKLNEDEFDDLLNKTQNDISFHIDRQEQQQKYHFNVYEGPSLNESAVDFEKNIFCIYKKIVEGESKIHFHQVLFTLAPGPITAAIKTTIRVCTDIFSDLSSLFTFVHTKIDYSRLHSGNAKFTEFVQERQSILWEQIHAKQNKKSHINQERLDPKLIDQQQLQRSSKPFLIDCNFQTKWPVRKGKTLSVVRDILSTAATQTVPVAMRSSLMMKLPGRIEADLMLKWKVKDEFEQFRVAIAKCGAVQTDLLRDMEKLDKRINLMVKGLAKGDQEVVYAKRHDIQDGNDTTTRYFTMEFDGCGRVIERPDLKEHNIKIEQQLGGEGLGHWMVLYRRKAPGAAFLEVKLYAKKFDAEVARGSESEDLVALQRQRKDLELKLAKIEEQMMDLSKVQLEYYLLRDWISRLSLPVDVMQGLTSVEADEVSETPLDKMKNVYLRGKDVYCPDPSPSKGNEDYEHYLPEQSDHSDNDGNMGEDDDDD